MLKELLSKLGASTRITVGVSVSPGIGLEMIEIDRTTGTVNKYANKPLEYNFSTREIANYEEFREALSDLFDELAIPKKSNIILSLPNVYFGMINLPLLLTDEAVTNAIISEVEQSYIFKRQEPVVSWTENYSNLDTENRVLAYTAVQKPVIDGVVEACNDIGCKVIGIENSYASLLRALQYTGLAKEQMKENNTWNLMVIGQNSYSILSLVDKRILEYYEEPLALKSFVDDEIYNAITTSAQLTLASLPANNLLIVSETDLVSAEVLALKMPVECMVNFLECNKFMQQELMPVNLNILQKTALQISLESIGVATTQFCDFPLKINLIHNQEILEDSGAGVVPIDSDYPRINIGNLEVELTPSFIKKIAIILGVIIIFPMFAASLWLGHYFLPKEQEKLNQLNNRIMTVNEEIKKYSAGGDNTFNLKAALDKIITQNKTKITYYQAIGMSTPNQLWISYYRTNSEGKVDLKGKSNDVESVYTFYKNMKQLVNNSDIKLHKLEIPSESIDELVLDTTAKPQNYIFEITNMPEGELKKPEIVTSADGKTKTLKPEFEFGFKKDEKGEGENKQAENASPQEQKIPDTSKKPLLPFMPPGNNTPVGGSGAPNLKPVGQF